MYLCPRCHVELAAKPVANGASWQCGSCGGRTMGFGVLRKTVGPQPIAELVNQAMIHEEQMGCACPICTHAMSSATLNLNGHEVPLDLCVPCAFVWFDANEFEAMPAAPPPLRVLGEIDMSKLPIEAREKLAMAQVRQIAEQDRLAHPEPEEPWKAVPAVFGMPVELDAPPLTHTPWATYGLSLIIAAASLAAFPHLSKEVSLFGLVPDEFARDHGLTLFTSFFLHGSLFHLASNLYFLLVFGRRVEDDFGPVRWLLLVALATLTGDFLHILGNLHDTAPCIGASGGISGLLAYYALRFPGMRLGYLFTLAYTFFRWIQFPAYFAFIFWAGLQIVGAVEQHFGLSNVASLAHLGGVFPGIIFWAIWGRRKPEAEVGTSINPIRVKIE